MAENSKIAWTHHTHNSWWGCTIWSAGCSTCYALDLSRRHGHDIWGPKAGRRFLSDANWNKPLKWNRDAEKAGERRRVFTASMSDVFERHMIPEINAQMDAARARLWALVDQTPWLDWQILTKRPDNIMQMVPEDWLHSPRHNVWFGTSVEDQEQAVKRIPFLQAVPAVCRFLSVEPMIGPVNLDRIFGLLPGATWAECLCDEIDPDDVPCLTCTSRKRLGELSGIDWVIIGGESGPKARPMEKAWAYDLVDQCRHAGVAIFVKQLGTVWAREHGQSGKADEMEAFPEGLRIREFPEVEAVDAVRA